MSNSYTTALCEASNQYEEKKSVFYGFIKPIETEEEAISFIQSVREKIPNAKHVCYAYVNRGGNVVRFSDDKEPQGTAGMPILEVIRREGLTGVVIAVARYFGGILLGAGGLTRAYAKAAKLALDASGKTTFVLYKEALITVDYSSFQKLKYELNIMNVNEYDTEYNENVSCKVLLDEEEIRKVQEKTNTITSGKGTFKITGERYAPKKICQKP